MPASPPPSSAKPSSGQAISRNDAPPSSGQNDSPDTMDPNDMFGGGTFGLPCALVIKHLAEGERHDKAALNDVLRTHGVAL